jgi:hypothetical protein
MRAAAIFDTMPPDPMPDAETGVGHRLDARVDALDARDMHRAVLRGVAVVEAVDVGQQDDAARCGGLRDPRRKAVVVAETDFLGCDAVILVDDRHDAEAEQPVERRRGVEIAAAMFEVVERHQHLRRGQPFGAEHFGPDL